MVSVICEELGVERLQVTPTAKITADLGADSLGRVALSMQLQQSFGFELSIESDFRTRRRSTKSSRPNSASTAASQSFKNSSDWDDVLTTWDNILLNGTVAEVFELLIDSLSTGKTAGDEDLKLTRAGDSASRETRQTQTITSSPLFVGFFETFMLNAAEVAQGINDNLAGARIEHITLVRVYDHKRLTSVHVILLSERRLFYWRLELQTVLLFSEDISDVNIDATYAFKNKTLESIYTSVTVSGRPNDSTRNFGLEFSEPPGLHGAAKFLRKYNRFRSALP
jgi:acyl carrier protein